MTRARLVNPQGQSQSLDVIMEPFLSSHSGGPVTVDEMADYLLSQECAGIIVIEPGADVLKRLAVEGLVVTWARRQREEDDIRRFAVNRRGGRYDWHTGRLMSLLEAERQEYAESIRQYLLFEGPRAYRSQARLLVNLDPQTDLAVLADQCAAAVHESVLSAGVEELELVGVA